MVPDGRVPAAARRAPRWAGDRLTSLSGDGVLMHSYNTGCVGVGCAAGYPSYIRLGGFWFGGILIHKFYVDVDREYQEHCVSGFLLEQYSARINLDRYTLNAQTTNL